MYYYLLYLFSYIFVTVVFTTTCEYVYYDDTTDTTEKGSVNCDSHEYLYCCDGGCCYYNYYSVTTLYVYDLFMFHNFNVISILSYIYF